MSLDMCVYYKDGTHWDKPIAGFFTFDKYWFRPRKVLRLQYVPEMESGTLTIKRKRDVELILKEFERLKEYHLKRGLLPVQMDATRIDEMIEVCHKLLDEWETIDHVSF